MQISKLHSTPLYLVAKINELGTRAVLSTIISHFHCMQLFVSELIYSNDCIHADSVYVCLYVSHSIKSMWITFGSVTVPTQAVMHQS